MEQESQLINRPQKSLISGSSNIQRKGRLISSNIVHGSFQISSRNSHVDGESNDSKKNVDEELRVLLVPTPGAQMAKKALKTPDNNNRVKNPHKSNTMYKDSHMMAL